MYSEIEDFKEKHSALAKMEKTLLEFCDQKSIDNFSLALEIGGSGGLLSGMISRAGPRVICTDVTDVQVQYGGEFPRLLSEKFRRNGLDLDLGKIEFHTADAQNLLYGDSKFDFVFSLNALEHIPDPITAIKEAWRVLRPRGIFYASFDPVWTADSGGHFMHYTREPWLHLLMEDDDYCKLMKSEGATDQELDEYRYAMNRKPAAFYLTEFKQCLEKIFSEHCLNHWSGCISDQFNDHPNLHKAAKKTGHPTEELMIRGFQIIAIK